jgi:hypothetical protein
MLKNVVFVVMVIPPVVGIQPGKGLSAPDAILDIRGDSDVMLFTA